MRLDRLITLNLVRPLHWMRGRLPSSVFGLRSSAPRLPILMYHSISDSPEPGVAAYYRTCTSPTRFREQMQWLKANGYRGVTLKDGLAWLNSQNRKQKAESRDPKSAIGNRQSAINRNPKSQLSTLNSQPVVLTFDDGFRDFYTTAFPMLQQHGFSATMFLPTAFLQDHANRKSEISSRITQPPPGFQDKEFLSWYQVRELHQAGIEFGSHTVNHPKLLDLSWPEIESEISDSKSQIEQQLGAPVPAFAYPYAFPQADDNFANAFRQLLHRVGYASCVTTRVGCARPGDDRLRLSRLPVNSADDDALLRGKLAGHYDWLAFPQAMVKQFKHAVRPARKPTESPVRWSVVSGP